VGGQKFFLLAPLAKLSPPHFQTVAPPLNLCITVLRGAAHRQTDRQTDRMRDKPTDRTISALAEYTLEFGCQQRGSVELDAAPVSVVDRLAVIDSAVIYPLLTNARPTEIEHYLIRQLRCPIGSNLAGHYKSGRIRIPPAKRIPPVSLNKKLSHRREAARCRVLLSILGSR